MTSLKNVVAGLLLWLQAPIALAPVQFSQCVQAFAFVLGQHGFDNSATPARRHYFFLASLELHQVGSVFVVENPLN